MSNTDGDGDGDRDVDESGQQDEGLLLDDYGDENVDIFASSLLQPSSPSTGVIASSYIDHVHKYNEEELENEMIDRLVVFMGRMGVGKTSLFGCYQGNENLQKLQLASHTRSIKAAYFAKTYHETRRITVGFKCYDTQGFTGNPKVDLVLLNNLIDAIRLNVPKIHVIFFCLSAVRFLHDDETIIRLIRTHGGDDLINRLKFVVTNAPERLVSEELRVETQTKLSEVTGRTITADDIIYSNLIDPNQFEPDSDLHRATKRYWLENKLRLQQLTRDIPEESSFHINKISTVRKVRSLVHVYAMDIGIVVFSAVICLLLVGLVMLHLRNEALVSGNETLRAEMERIRSTPVVMSPPEVIAATVVKGIVSVSTGVGKGFVAVTAGAWGVLFPSKK
eukprot:gene10199-7274_t